MNGPVLNFTDSKGRALWIAQGRCDFAMYLPDIKASGQRYRILNRTVSALGGSVEVCVLVIFPRGK